ncbi:MAG: hypothetical protein EXR51_08490 [Dehalococcoidia bacterium]|nr:hypothetical protein [Dehalococcoidia bacterium]
MPADRPRITLHALRIALRVVVRTLLGTAVVLNRGLLVLRQPWPFVIESRSFLSYIPAEERQLEESSSRRIQEIAPAPEGLPVDGSPTGLWELRAIRAQEAWAALDLRWSGRASERTRVKVGVYDGAMATGHPDLAPNLEDDDPPESWATAFAWLFGVSHGVGMMGIIGGAGAPGMIGAAPRSIVIPFHTLRSGRDTSLSAALSYFHARGVRLANFAIATAVPLGPALAVQEAAEAGVLIVTGLPNRDAEVQSYPAAYPGVVTASGVDNKDEPAGFGWGDLVDVAAAVVGMPTTAAVLRFGPLGLGAPYGRQCCNSVASALTTAVAALILESDPSLTSAQVEKRIKLSARKPAGMLDAQGRPVRWHPRLGYGVLDAYGAVTLDQIGPDLQTSVIPEGREVLLITGPAIDDILDTYLQPSRARDDHLRGVPTSNIATVEYRTGLAGWQAAPLEPARGPASRYARTFAIRIDGAVMRLGGTIELRAWDTAGNVSPIVSVPVIVRRH